PGAGRPPSGVEDALEHVGLDRLAVEGTYHPARSEQVSELHGAATVADGASPLRFHASSTSSHDVKRARNATRRQCEPSLSRSSAMAQPKAMRQSPDCGLRPLNMATTPGLAASGLRDSWSKCDARLPVPATRKVCSS